MNCNNNCQICDRLTISSSVTIVTVGGIDTLVVDIPAGSYYDCQRICLVIAQAIPAAATINMPVAISIGGDTATVYPLTRCDCVQVTACAIRTRTKYPLKVATNATSAVFKVLRGLSCAPNNALAAIPTATTPAPTPATAAETQRTATVRTAQSTQKGGK